MEGMISDFRLQILDCRFIAVRVQSAIANLQSAIDMTDLDRLKADREE